MLGSSSLSGLPFLRDATRGRASSYDVSGGNLDFWKLDPGETRVLAEIEGPGAVRHIWMTLASREEAYPRRSVIRMYWDGAETPCVEAPTGDFFGVGHGLIKEYWSLPLTMSPREGRGFNCYWPMPFNRSARITMTNEGERHLIVYFYIDYERYPAGSRVGNPTHRIGEGGLPPDAGEGGLPSGAGEGGLPPGAGEGGLPPGAKEGLFPEDREVGLFHAQYRQEHPTKGWGDDAKRFEDNAGYRAEVFTTPNTSGEENYVILEAAGRGHYVGCNPNVDCHTRLKNDWYGEGDDMIFIDGDPKPTLHGTGTEDYFGTAWSPNSEFCTPYHGQPLAGTPEPGWEWKGQHSVYRYHIEDPVHFRESIRVTIEHGHANNLSNDYSSTAYWYQTEPHGAQAALPTVADRLPRR